MSNKSLKNKTAIITGATKGIGFAIAKLLGEQGANIVITGRKKEGVLKAESELKQLDVNCLGVQAHSGDSQALDMLVDKTIGKYKYIDIVVNNAATNPVYGPVLELEDSVIDKVINVNLKAIIKLSSKALPYLKETKGTIINISSIDGIKPEVNRGLYGVSKAALNSLTKVLAKELGKFNIRVNTICPGIIKTSFSKILWTDEKIKTKVEKNIPMRRFGKPEEIAELVLFLASSKSSYSTGSFFVADGGYIL
ncbi:MAG: SDR family NAD(P)-dependent oxidoreductase [Tenacibaculum sp.]